MSAAPLFKTLEKRRGEHAAVLKEEEGGRKGKSLHRSPCRVQFPLKILRTLMSDILRTLNIRCAALGHCGVARVREAL